MTLERVDRLTAAPVVGRYYLVPTVRYEWYSKIKPWPVMGAIHNDADRFAFPADHYHLDPRFVPEWCLYMRLFASPLSELPGSGPLPSIQFRSVRCRRAMVKYPHHDRKEIIGIQRDFAGQQCASGKGGWICPHRKYSLGSIDPIDGVITCPLHGMKIDAATGRVVAPLTSQHHGKGD